MLIGVLRVGILIGGNVLGDFSHPTILTNPPPIATDLLAANPPQYCPFTKRAGNVRELFLCRCLG